MRYRRLTSVLPLVALFLIALPASQAENGMEVDAESAQMVSEEPPDGGVVNGNEIVYPDGSGFVTLDVEGYSLGQCSAARFCMWANTNYTGPFSYVSGSGITKTLDVTVRSFWNNRTTVVRLYNNAGTASTCYGPGAKVASVATAYQAPAKVYLSSGTTC